jgi:dipeptidase
MAPSLNLSPWVEDGYTEAYPFSVKPDQKLSVHDVMALHRDHYEGTPFDMTKGIAAGPYGYPNRYYGPYEAKGDVGDPDKKPEGAWERAISVSYCGYVFVNQARGWLPNPIGGVMWMGLDKPSETCFIPFYAGVTALPKSFEVMNPGKFSRESAWWAFNFVANWAALKYSYMIKDIQGMQQALEQEQTKALEAVEAEAIKLHEENPEEARAYLTEFCLTNADQVIGRWWDFSEELIGRYSDGFINAPGHMAQEVGYPEEWRKAAGWFEGPTQYKPRQGQQQE